MSAPFAIEAASTAREAGLASCHCCGALAPQESHECPRCGSAVHLRTPDSLARTAALLSTAALLLVPANLFQIMTVRKLGQGEPHTILGGVQELVHAGMWSLALVVFVASIVVPVMKLIVLSCLCWSVHRGWRGRPRDRTALYRVTEALGRWSMIDVFVISILVALVKLGAIATIAPGPGATYFAAVVVVTMIAAECFDPRLIWDRTTTVPTKEESA